jgi:hypothetical protein
MKAKLIVAFVFLCASASIAGGFYFAYFRPHDVDEVAAAGSVVVFLVAAIAASLKTRRGCWIGLAGAGLALPWFIRLELVMAPWNSWLSLNCEAARSFESTCGPLFMRWRLLALVLIAISVACSVLCLLPARWNLRLWHSFAISFLGLAIWFVHSVSLYQLPVFDHGVPARLRVLHVEKRGFRFYETGVFEFRDGKVWATHADRRWFQYRFEEKAGTGVVSLVLYERANAFIEAAKGWNLHTQPPKPLWSWNAEGWYVITSDRRFSFVGREPPEAVRALFHEFERVAPAQGVTTVRDVCLGFCYDPPAALGPSSLRARSWLLQAQ